MHSGGAPVFRCHACSSRDGGWSSTITSNIPPTLQCGPCSSQPVIPHIQQKARSNLATPFATSFLLLHVEKPQCYNPTPLCFLTSLCDAPAPSLSQSSRALGLDRPHSCPFSGAVLHRGKMSGLSLPHWLTQAPLPSHFFPIPAEEQSGFISSASVCCRGKAAFMLHYFSQIHGPSFPEGLKLLKIKSQGWTSLSSAFPETIQREQMP